MAKPKENTKLAADAERHTADALETILEIMRDPKHKDRMRAAQEILNRAYGPADKQTPPEVEVANGFLNGKLSASDAALLIQAYGEKVPQKITEAANREERKKRFRAC